MKIAVFGSGGVGGYFGARLAAAGEDVHFIARGRHLDAIRSAGLKIRSPLGDVLIDPAQATGDAAAVGAADVVIVAVKLYDTEAAAEACKPLVGPASWVVSLQNGVTAADVLVTAFGRNRVVGGSSSIAARIEAPGVIVQTGTMATIAFGEWDGGPTPRTEALHKACGKAGIEATLADDITGVIWSKFVFLAAFSGITAMLRLPAGPIRDSAGHRHMFRRAMEETAAVAAAKGVALAGDLVDQRMAFLDGLAPEMYASMYHDLMAGKRLELPWLSGAVVDLGRALGVHTPVHGEFLAALDLPIGGGEVPDS